MTPGDVRACFAVLSRSGRFLRSANARSISSSSQKCSALPLALRYYRSPFRPVDEALGIPSTSLTTPSLLYPRRSWFLGVRLGYFAHRMNHTNSKLRKQEIRISRITMIWMIKRIL